jgi:trimeric autotransporter adhesin
LVQNPGSPPVAVFPVLHSGAPASFQPIIPLQLYPAGAFASEISIPQGELALQNSTQNSVDVTLVHSGPDLNTAAVTMATLAPGTTSVQPAPESNVSMDYVIPTAPIRMAQGQPANFGSVSAYVVPPPQLAIYNGNNTVASGVKFKTSVGAKPAPVTLTVANAFPISFTASASTASTPTISGGQWLSVSPQQGTACTAYIGSYPPTCPASNQVTISVDPSTLASGTYTGTLTFLPQAPSPQPTTVAVTLTVYATPQISADQSSIGFNFQAGDPSSSQTIHLTSTADPAAFTATASTQSGQKWLSVSPAQGQTPAALTVTLTPSAFAAQAEPTRGGTSDQGTITITGPGNTLVVPVTAQIPPPPTPPVITVTPTAMQIPYQIGQPNPAALNLEPHLSTSLPPVGNPFTVSAQTASGGNWLSAAVPANFAVPYIIVSANPAGLASGTYQGNVTVSSALALAPVQVPVTLYVFSTPPPITASPSALSFTVVQGTVSTPQTVNIATGAIPLVLTSAIATSDSNNWLKLQINNYVDDYLQSVGQPNTPTTATVTVDATNQPPGSYTGTIALTAPEGSSNSVTIPVNVTVQAALPPPPPPAFIPVAPMGTVPLVTAILNGASQSPGSLSPGEIITIFGQNFVPATPNGLILSSNKVTTSNSGVQVLFDNIPAPLLYVSSTQINAIVPYEVTGTTTSVTVQYIGAPIAAGSYAVSPSSPAIFTQDSTGQGAAAVLNQDNILNTSANPAMRGSTIQIYATGAGGPGVTGGVTESSTQTPTQSVTPSVTLAIGGQPATVTYAGGAPGEVSGVLQVNAVVPQNITPGASTPVVLTIGTAQSPSLATISVK